MSAFQDIVRHQFKFLYVLLVTLNVAVKPCLSICW